MIEYKNKFIHIKITEPDNEEERKLFYEDFESATRLWAALENVTLQQRMEEEDRNYVHVFSKGKKSH